MRWETAGWLTILVLYPALLLAVCVTHLYVHWRASRTELAVGKLIAISHVLLVIAFLLQWDVGDGEPWLTITDLLGKVLGFARTAPPTWWPVRNNGLAGILTNLLLFAPAIVTWMFLSARGRANTPGSASR
jgi:hypothetical protein